MIRKAVYLVFLTGSLLVLAVGSGIAQIPSFAPADNFPAGSTSLFVAVGDFNADGIQDLAVANVTAIMFLSFWVPAPAVLDWRRTLV